MGKRKRTAWLGVNQNQGRGSSTKPMSPEKLAVRWRQFIARSSKAEPGTDENGTRQYAAPKDPPDLERMRGQGK